MTPQDDSPELSTCTMTALESFLAMSRFVAQFAERAGNDLITLLGDIHTEADGRPTDPAAWSDWLKCTGFAGLEGSPAGTSGPTSKPPPSSTPEAAFLAMKNFLWKFAERAGDDLAGFRAEVEVDSYGRPVNHVIWSEWVTCLDDAQSGTLSDIESKYLRRY